MTLTADDHRGARDGVETTGRDFDSARGAPARSLRRRVAGAITHTLGVVAITATTILIGRWSGAFTGAPKGYDAPGHLAKIHLITATYPHVNWNAAWYAGSPSFVGSYPPGYHAVVATLSQLFHISPARSMLLVAGASLLMIVVGLYAFVWSVSRSRLGGLVAVALVLSGPTQWGQILQDGLYPRLLGMGFAAIALALVPSCARKPTARRLALVALVLALAGVVHPLAAVLGGIVGSLVMLAMAENRWRVLRDVAVLGGSTLSLAGFFYVPYFFGTRPHSLFDYALQPTPWKSLVWPSGNNLAAFSPTFDGVVVVVLALGIALFVRARRVLRKPEVGLPGIHSSMADPEERRDAHRVQSGVLVAGVLAAAGVAAVLYCIAGHLWSNFPYIQGLDPQTLLTYPEWLLAGAGGMTVGLAVHSGRLALPRWTRAVPPLAGAVSLAGFAIVVPLLPAGAVSFQGPGLDSVQAAAALTHNAQDFRIVADAPLAAEALNTWTTTPQTGGYEDQAEINPQWDLWLEEATSTTAWNADERLFLLDWYAGRWIFLSQGSAEPVYAADKARFALAATEPYLTVYRVRAPSPIVSVSNAPTALFVGDSQHYQLFLQALADSDVNSRRVIPLYAGSSVSALTPGELQSASCVVVYGATDPNPAAANALLTTYVAHGGRLFVDQGDEGTASPLPDSAGLLPVESTNIKLVYEKWAFTVPPRGYLNRRQLRGFSPPDYASTGSWQVVAARKLEPGAKAVLRSTGSVVLASRSVGSGTVLWSGLNLPYHIAVFKNAAESRLFAELIGAAPRPVDASRSTSKVQAEQVQAVGSGRGVLVRESISPDWHATLDGKAAPIEMAGPGMMYIPLPRGATATVLVTYHFSHVELAGIFLSIFALAALVAVLSPFRLPALRRERRRRIREQLEAALLEPDPMRRAAAINELSGQPLEPYAALLLSFSLLELEPPVHDALVNVVKASKMTPTSNTDLTALRIWAWSQQTRRRS